MKKPLRKRPDPDQHDAFARHTDPLTSHLAAGRVNVPKREQEALDALRGLPLRQGTSREIARAAGVDKWSISPRMKPLERKGFVRRLSTTRASQIVWEAT